jgi:putative spermidine/putrescine transport system ATP-binding protein
VAALDGVTLRVEEGELVTILGPSGSGKTTMLSLIAGLTSPSAGTIRLGERDVTWTPPARRNIGLVFQSYALFPHMSVFDNVAFPLSIRRVPPAEIRRRVQQALSLVRLDGYGDRRPGELSGGQQQRVALARAVVFEPAILLLDEPLGALDRKLREEVQVELRRLQRTLGVTTVLVTHDQEEALSLSDRIVVLSEGQLQQCATPEEAYQRPSNAFVAGFLGVANMLEGAVETGPSGRSGLRLKSGEFAPCAFNPAVARASQLRAVIRSERLRLVPLEDAHAYLRATVTDTVYLGQTVRYHLSTSGGHAMIAAANAASDRFKPGETVALTWADEDAWVLPESSNKPH